MKDVTVQEGQQPLRLCPGVRDAPLAAEVCGLEEFELGRSSSSCQVASSAGRRQDLVVGFESCSASKAVDALQSVVAVSKSLCLKIPAVVKTALCVPFGISSSVLCSPSTHASGARAEQQEGADGAGAEKPGAHR